MERFIRFGSIKVPLTVGSGKESSRNEVKICSLHGGSCSSAASARVTWFVVFEVLGGRSMCAGRGYAMIRFCIDVISNMQ
jgi:hypothetical protein